MARTPGDKLSPSLLRMIYTSSFTNGGTDPRAVSVARTCPEWFNGSKILKLAPPEILLKRYKNNKINTSVFSKNYKTMVLGVLDPEKVYYMLDGKILCCWEPKNQFCHRHIISEWLRENGFNAKEM